MSFNSNGETIPKIAASALGQYVVVTGHASGNNLVSPAADQTVDPIGVTIASTPTYGYAAAIVVSGEVKVLMAASCGPNQRVSVASSNGAVGPIAASGMATALGSALGAQGARYSIGWLHEGRAAGEYGTVHLDPRQVI